MWLAQNSMVEESTKGNIRLDKVIHTLRVHFAEHRCFQTFSQGGFGDASKGQKSVSFVTF